jgi:hypothetical protein
LTGKKDFKLIKTDIKKLLTALKLLIDCQKYPSLFNFYKSTWNNAILTNQDLLGIMTRNLLGIIPYQASMPGPLAASAVSILVITS